MFWLLTVHIYDQTFLRGGIPTEDPIHLLYVLSIVIVVGLHVGAFIKVVAHYREHGKYPTGI
jgi:sulfoxide reductase heme-binding subunit YedZ